jgi:fatty acid desaturase
MSPWRAVLSREEIRDLVTIRDHRAWLSLVLNWSIIFGSLALVAWWPHWPTLPLVVVLATFLIGGRQLGLAILMHDAAHHVLFSNRALNDGAGNWLAAFPTWTDVGPYREYHLQHHAKNYTAEDPDLGLTLPFPVTRGSLRRKIVRDLTGQTGWKRVRATLNRDLGRSRGRQARTVGGLRNLRGVVLSNAILLTLCLLSGHPAVYLVWVLAWMTTFQLATRVRAIAEHAMAPDTQDPLRNTRTTLVNPIERLLFAPNGVNYHLEHHLLMTVPHYNLPRLHHLLRERGALADAWIEPGGYRAVLTNAAPVT